MAHVARLGLNCLGFASNVFALKTLQSGVVFENPLASGFGGQYMYLTVIGLVPASLACGLKVVRHFKPTFAQNTYEIITNLATPLQGFISLIYWSIMLIDPTMLLPAELGRIPVLLDVALHLFPGVFLWTDYLVFETEFKRSNSHVKMIYGFGAAYYLWVWICYKVNGFWAYPFLAEFNFPLRTAFFACTGALCMMVYEGGAILHDKIHGSGKKQQKKIE